MSSQNGLWVVSTFAGCGGSSLGWKQAGFGVAAAVEFDDHAAETYRLNASPETNVLHCDIRTVTGSQLLDEAERCSGRRELDILDGSPPCQSWSMAGKRELMSDPNGELYSEFVGLVEEALPRAFVSENVEGLTMGLARIPLYRIMRQLAEAGYSVHGKVLKAQYLGVPQTRHRLFLVGFRDDLGLDAREWFPVPLERRTMIGDVLPEVVRLVRLARPATVHAEWQREESWSADDTAPTLLAGGLGHASASYVRVEPHDGDFRKPTLSDLLALSTFPPDFQIEGDLAKQWKRLGNSVPPRMMRAVAERVRDALLIDS